MNLVRIAIERGLRAEKKTWDEIADALQLSSASVRRVFRQVDGVLALRFTWTGNNFQIPDGP